MADSNNSKLKTMGLIITLILIFAGLITSWTTAKNTQVYTTTNLEELKKDGCYLSRKNKDDVTSLKSDIRYIKESLSRIENALKNER